MSAGAGEWEVGNTDTRHRGKVQVQLESRPSDRELWILWDACERFAPLPESAFFYEALAWLHGDDPWVRNAVAEYRKRAGEKAPVDTENLAQRLAAYEPRRWPTSPADPTPSRLPDPNKTRYCVFPYGEVAAAVKQLSEAGDFERARDFALRYLGYAVSVRTFEGGMKPPYELMAYCHHLWHLVDREAKASARGKTSAVSRR
ncbi:MAG: hypothetical protein JXR37_06875 [Kiritimatiellae bacterium]|nr:hypothetical protein [Kiritimatiellia bacterium]